MTLDVVILAAGQGTRMRSARPKVLHELAGRPLIDHVIATASSLEDARLHVVIGHGGEQVREALADAEVNFVVQAEQKGTGHAVVQALEGLGDGKVLILYADVPLIRRDTLAALLERVGEQCMGLLTVELNEPAGYGRIKRDADGEAVAIGIVMAFDLSVRMGLCPGEDAARVRRHIADTGLPTSATSVPGLESVRAETLVDHMRQDKKVRDKRLTFILCRGIGQAFVTSDVDEQAVIAMLGEELTASV